MGILSARLKSGLTQAAVAEKLGISAAAVCQWETGKTLPDSKKLKKLAEIYQCTIDDLLAPDSAVIAEEEVRG